MNRIDFTAFVSTTAATLVAFTATVLLFAATTIPAVSVGVA
jgi:hypothetical protein